MRAYLAAVILAAPLVAQRLDPVKWSVALDPAEAPPGGTVTATVTATLEPGWHLYSMSTPPPPRPTRLTLADNPATERTTVYQQAPRRAFDPNFGVETETYEEKAVFLVEIALKGDAPEGAVDLAAQVRYQACDAKRCLPPVTRAVAATLKISRIAARKPVVIPAGFAPPVAPAAATPPKPTDEGLAAFLLVAFGFGVAAIFTPCVFPMIPITMSYFLNRPQSSRAAGAFHAALFCLGIVVLFSGLGLAVTAAMGPFGVVQLGSNIWVNAFIAAVFLAFGLSLLGAFEITIPSSVLTRLDGMSQRGGVA